MGERRWEKRKGKEKSEKRKERKKKTSRRRETKKKKEEEEKSPPQELNGWLTFQIYVCALKVVLNTV